jgi:hypothetical protein
VIFSRNRGSGGRHHKVEDARRARHAAQRRTHDEFGADPDEDGPLTTGPYDILDAPDEVERLDLGSLKIPAVPGIEIRVAANPEGQVEQVVLVAGESAMQLGALAAPRTEGIWDEVRATVRQQFFDEGMAAEEIPGPYGTELRARVRTPEGMVDLRFVGVDGPRWMVRAIYQGPAAVDPEQAGPLAECLHGVVVDRGNEAMPVNEVLPLTLPSEMVDQAGPDAGADDGPAAGPDTAPPANGSAAPGRPPKKPSPRPRRR